MPQIRALTYQNSFFPQSIKNWNELSKKDREICTFKEHQNKKSGFKNNHLYHLYSSKAATNHTRIKLGLSGLASQCCD
jgi:hypothetical protein